MFGRIILGAFLTLIVLYLAFVIFRGFGTIPNPFKELKNITSGTFSLTNGGPQVNTGNYTVPAAKPITFTNAYEGQSFRTGDVITGTAPRSWFVQSVFPVIVLDENGNQTAILQAKMGSTWQDQDPVPFTVSFVVPGVQNNAHVSLLFKKSNPSGLAKDDVSQKLRLIVNNSQTDISTRGQCIRTGCSNELCVDQNSTMQVASSCQYTRQFQCLNTAARCERQNNGACGWTYLNSYNQCVQTAQ